MDALTLKKKWNDFWLSKTHSYLPESSLLADKSWTSLFNVAGMQQLIPYLMGKDHSLWKRLFNIQRCIRTVDIDEVGDESHLTYFDMMGNWSLWDYFKKESLEWSWEFLVNILKLDPRKLAATVYLWSEDTPKDEFSYQCWLDIWLPEAKISYLSDNWRSPGPVWPCGPDSEIFYWVGESEFPPEGSNVENDENNWLEIWNNVFMEYYRDEDWKLTKLSQQNVDTGMGFERMCKVLQHKNTIFETDIFFWGIKILEQYTEKKYTDNLRRFRIILDHLRTAFRLIYDGLRPSNIGAGYVLRMVIRRMYYNFVLIHELSVQQLENFIVEELSFFDTFFSFWEEKEQIISVLLWEIQQFKKTLANGIKIIDWLLLDLKPGENLSWEKIFMLYDTYGFPLELTKEITDEKWVLLDEEWFILALEVSKEKSRQASKAMFDKWIDRSKYIQWIEKTQFIGYDMLYTQDMKLLQDIDIDWQRVLIFDKTPFYAESGGQTWDQGSIILDDGSELKIIDVKKYEWVFLHFVE